MPKNDNILGQALNVFKTEEGHFRIQLEILVSTMDEAKRQASRLTELVDENCGDDDKGIVLLNRNNFLGSKGPGVADDCTVPIVPNGKPN